MIRFDVRHKATLALGLAALCVAARVNADDVLGKAPWGLVAAKGAATLKMGTSHELQVTVAQATPKYYELQLTP